MLERKCFNLYELTRRRVFLCLRLFDSNTVKVNRFVFHTIKIDEFVPQTAQS